MTDIDTKIDFLYMTRDQKEKHDQPCERVYVCCGGKEAPMGTGHYSNCASFELASLPYECLTHGCAWPEKGPCPEGAKE